jgi:hypothetical protein
MSDAPSNKWSWHRPPPVAKAAEFVRYVGPGWDAVAGRKEAVESHTYEPLPPAIPIAQPAGPPQEPPPRPTDLELRDRLKTALGAEQESGIALEHAAEAHQRATALVQQRRAEVEVFANLDGEIDEFTISALRGDGKADLPDELRQKRADRDHAVAALASAERAQQKLAADLTVARSQRDARSRATHSALVPLLARKAEGYAAQIHDCEAEIKRLEQLLLGFERICDSPAHMPESVRGFWFTTLQNRIGTAEHLKPWDDAAQQLRADPDAEVTIADPEPPPPKENLVIVPPWLQALRARDAAVRAAREAEAAQAQEPPSTPEEAA